MSFDQRTRFMLAAAAAWAWGVGAAPGQPIIYTARSGENVAYCGAPGSGPAIDRRFLTPAPTDDVASVSDDGDGQRPATAATCHLVAVPGASGIQLACTASAMRGAPAANGAYATADARDYWTFRLAAPVCFSLAASLQVNSTDATGANSAFQLLAMSGAGIRLSTGGTTFALIDALNSVGSRNATFSGTLAAGEYVVSLNGRTEGNSSPFSGSFNNSLDLRVGTSELSQMPQSATACVSEAAEFSVAASGTGPFSYQWQVQSAPNGAWLNLGSAPVSLPCGGSALASPLNSPTVQIAVTPCPGVHDYQIRCVVSTGCGPVASEPATLTVCACLACSADFNQDGGIDGSDIDSFFATWQAGFCDADINADGGVDGGDVDTFFAAWEAGGCG